MSKVTVAILSFALGVFSSTLVLAAHCASAAPQQAPPSKPASPGPVLVGGAGVPVVPPITQHFQNFGVINSPLPFQVDGSDCVRCTFSGAVFRYGGGNFQFTDFKFSGPVRVEFTGAARNTFIFIKFIEALAASQVPKGPAPKTPTMQLTSVKQDLTGTFGTE
jgi:hypothetical protein